VRLRNLKVRVHVARRLAARVRRRWLECGHLGERLERVVDREDRAAVLNSGRPAGRPASLELEQVRRERRVRCVRRLWRRPRDRARRSDAFPGAITPGGGPRAAESALVMDTLDDLLACRHA